MLFAWRQSIQLYINLYSFRFRNRISKHVRAYTIFMNGRHTIFCLAMFSKKFMLPYYQALKNMLFWEVTASSVERRQSYGSFKFKTFVWEITTKPHEPRFHVLARIQKPITSRQMRT